MNNLLILLQAAQQAAEQDPTFMQKYGSLFFIILLIVVFWLFFIRPQSKKAKEEQKYRDSLQKGDKVVTIGGFHGKVVEVKDTTVVISLAPNTEVEVEKSALVQSASNVGRA
jgi:preprotein translocase subunit YajC